MKAWLTRNPRITLHFTPTSGSWLNLVEIFFGIITRQAIRRRTFDSVNDLIEAITGYIEGWTSAVNPLSGPKTPTSARDTSPGSPPATPCARTHAWKI